MHELDEATSQGVYSILEAGVPSDDHPPNAGDVDVPMDEVPPTYGQPAGVLGKADEMIPDLELESNQMAALTAFKEAAGSGWKKKLKDCWKAGAYDVDIGENTRIALEQVKHLCGEDEQPDEVAGDVSGKAKLKTEAKNKFPWEEIGKHVLTMIGSPDVQSEIARIAGIDFTADPEAWASFYAELAQKFKSIGFLPKKPKKKEKPAPEPEPATEPDDIDIEPVGEPDAGGMPVDGGGGDIPLIMPDVATEASEDAMAMAINGDVVGAIEKLMRP